MDISMHDLAQKLLNSAAPSLVGPGDRLMEFDELFFWNEAVPAAPKGLLCIVRASALPAQGLPPSDSTWNLLCICDVPLPEWYLQAAEVNLILFPAGTSPQALYQPVASALAQVNGALRRLTDFLDKGARGNSMSSLADAISNVLLNPTALLSEGLKVIACSSSFSSSHPIWDALKEKRSYPGRIPDGPDGRKQLSRSLPRTAGAASCWETFVPVYSDNKLDQLMGFLYVLSPDEEFPAVNREIMHFIGHVISWHFWRYVHMPRRQNTHIALLLSELLSGSDAGDPSIQDRLKKSEYIPNTPQDLLVVEASAAEMPSPSWEQMKKDFSDIWPGSIPFPYSADLLLLVPHSEVQSSTHMERFQKQLQAYRCFAGISGPFQTLDPTFRNHYIRALSAARMAQELNFQSRYVHYDRIALAHLVFKGPPPVSLRQLCDPALLRLAAHDKHYNTQYTYTLWCYWHFDRDITRTCRHMHLHRNSLYYRLERIKELLGQDIDSTVSFLQLSLSLAIMERFDLIPHFDAELSDPCT